MRSDDLSKIVQYTIQQDYPSKKIIFIHIGLGIVAAISPITYIEPSYAEIPPYNLPDHPSVRTLEVISTWLPTTALLYLACVDFMETRIKTSVPPELEGILTGLSFREIRQQDLGIAFVSGLSAIPLTTPLVKYPLISTGDSNVDIPTNTALVAILLVSNGIAHLRPLQVIVNDPWYGAPFTAAKFLIQAYKDRRLTPEEKTARHLATQRAQASAQLKSLLIQNIIRQKTQLLDDCFVSRGIRGYQIKLNHTFNTLYDMDDDQLIVQLTGYRWDGDEKISSIQKTWKHTAYQAFLTLMSQIAGLLALGESVGYLADSGFELSKFTGSNWIGWGLAAIPIWAFGVLIHNAARASTQQNLDFAIQFVQAKAGLSWPIKYCAKTYFGILATPSFLLMLLNASAANTMIRADFADYCSDNFINQYISIFRWGFVWLASLLVIDMQKYIFTKWAKYAGSEDAQKIALFDEKMNNIISRLSQWQEERLQDWFSEQKPDLRKQLLHIEEEEYRELAERKDHALPEVKSSSDIQHRRQTSRCDRIYAFFCSRQSDSPSLLPSKHETSYSILRDEETSINSEPAMASSSWWSTLCCWRNRDREPVLLRSTEEEISREFEV